MKKKMTGVLLPLSSLPSTEGVGDMGEEAVTWMDILRDNGVRIWQILPLSPLGCGNSPYQPYSGYAGDEVYISIASLKKEGLVKEVPIAPQRRGRVDYQQVRALKAPCFREAFSGFLERELDQTGEYEAFASQKWVQDYARFSALRNRSDEKPGYYVFLQFVFYTQWNRLRREAKKRELLIMGDIPFYVGLDSADVWSGKDNFLMDQEGRPRYIAGVPPDYFSETGQRWGNPIYNWDRMRETGYAFWRDRIRHCAQMYDILRIDHFRAFDTYWKIPESCPTAVEGTWEEAPGYEVLRRITEDNPELELVAEDLGFLRKEACELRDFFGLKGMKVLLFSLDFGGRYVTDRFQDKDNMIMYTGTHDNETLREWYGALSPAKKRKLRKFLKRNHCFGSGIEDRMIRYTLKSRADMVIIPAADFMGLGSRGRINTPGTVGSPNWEWKIDDFAEIDKCLRKHKKIIKDRQDGGRLLT